MKKMEKNEKHGKKWKKMKKKGKRKEKVQNQVMKRKRGKSELTHTQRAEGVDPSPGLLYVSAPCNHIHIVPFSFHKSFISPPPLGEDYFSLPLLLFSSSSSLLPPSPFHFCLFSLFLNLVTHRMHPSQACTFEFFVLLDFFFVLSPTSFRAKCLNLRPKLLE
jgi:hypothetical protein